jgi:hypothetical protein
MAAPDRWRQARGRDWSTAHIADSRKRWGTDDRFTGVADASAFALAVEELAALARRPGWVAEDPEIHLVPHLRGASVDGVRIVEIRTGEAGVLAVDAECDPGASRGELRRRAWVLLGVVAEPAASVRERRDGDAAVFEVVTGIPDGAGPFASHGHTLRLTHRAGTRRLAPADNGTFQPDADRLAAGAISPGRPGHCHSVQRARAGIRIGGGGR